jgi:hypothetical protein
MRRRAGLLATTLAVLLVVGIVALGRLAVPSLNRTADESSTTPTVGANVSATPEAISTVSPNVGPVPTIPPEIALTPPAVPAQSVPGTASSTPVSKIYLPAVGGPPPGAQVAVAPTLAPTETPVPLPTAPPLPVGTPGVAPTQPPAPTPIPNPTRLPIRITKLGVGVYTSGGAMLPILDQARPSVILLMDPSVEFAKEVRQHFPKAFIVGRIYTADESLDNPTKRGRDFADLVAATAVPLKGVVDAWMSYNEIASPDNPQTLINYNLFQVAFAQHLQNDYGIPAVAGNDGPRAVPAALYPKYFAGAISTSKYFGFHLYPNQNVTSLRDPAAADQVFYYRQIKAALDAAGVPSGKFIATEVGLYNGWRGVISDTQMATDYTWLADQMNQDPYVLGIAVYGLFAPDRWPNFNVDQSNIPQIMGDYNTVH